MTRLAWGALLALALLGVAVTVGPWLLPGDPLAINDMLGATVVYAALVIAANLAADLALPLLDPRRQAG